MPITIDEKAKAFIDTTQTDSTLEILAVGATNRRMALHVKPAGTGASTWGSLLALWNKNLGAGNDEIFELTWQNDEVLFNSFANGAGTVRDVVFLSNAGTIGSEVARIIYGNGGGGQRFRLVKPQIPNNHSLYFLDYSGNERGKIYMYTDDVFVIESAAGDAIKLKASESAGELPSDRLVLKGGTQGNSGIEIYENLIMQTVSSKFQSIVLPVKGVH